MLSLSSSLHILTLCMTIRLWRLLVHGSKRPHRRDLLLPLHAPLLSPVAGAGDAAPDAGPHEIAEPQRAVREREDHYYVEEVLPGLGFVSLGSSVVAEVGEYEDEGGDEEGDEETDLDAARGAGCWTGDLAGGIEHGDEDGDVDDERETGLEFARRVISPIWMKKRAEGQGRTAQ